MDRIKDIFTNSKPIIGMVHLRPLPGSPKYNPVSMGMKKIIAKAKEEAKILEDAGVDGVQVENMWDIPYLPGRDIGPETIAALAVGVNEVVNSVSIPVGAECHMNGADYALACAVAGSARWVRVFEWCNAFISQSGYIEAIGGKLARMRSNLKADGIAFLCDINVKHGSHYIIHDRSVEEQAMDIEAQDGDAIIVTGFDTGMPPTVDKVLACKKKVSLPIFLGSGVTTNNAVELLAAADGAIVGSYFKMNGNWKNEIDPQRVNHFMREVEKLRKR
jgi:membrane complex biogenesis BtpA family protein